MTDEDILISQIRQETHIGLEEEGVEASAYTELMLTGTSMPAEEAALQLCFDRPFLYGILDSTGVPPVSGPLREPGRRGRGGTRRGNAERRYVGARDFRYRRRICRAAGAYGRSKRSGLRGAPVLPDRREESSDFL